MSAVKVAALAAGLEVRQPVKVRVPEVVEELRAMAPDGMVVVGYGQLIPQSIIDIPKHGIINVHGSLLPKYRGAGPIQWAIANGESESGVTTMRINAGLDTGDMLLKATLAIGPEENAVEYGERLAVLGANLLVETLAGLEAGRIVAVPQNDAEATHAPILTKADGVVDWNWAAAKIHNRTRGFYAWPGSSAKFRGQGVRIWKTRLVSGNGAAGTVLGAKGPLVVACGEATAIELVELQAEGRKRVSGADFRNGMRVTENERFE
jgi:methionyl-tRNA formyltransferase